MTNKTKFPMTEAITRFYTEKGLKSRINKIKKQKKAMAKRAAKRAAQKTS